MFEGEKTVVFWIGLIILVWGSLSLFQSLWMLNLYGNIADLWLRTSVPSILNGVVFIVLGLYMMKSGVKEKS
jgi:uncharacterized membrane protein